MTTWLGAVGAGSSWERTRCWVLSLKHGSKAAAHHLGVFNTTILNRKIWTKLTELRRAGSVLTANVPGHSPGYKTTAMRPVPWICGHGARSAKHENGGGRRDIGE